jgi:predicted O-methyltransferase YrrM
MDSRKRELCDLYIADLFAKEDSVLEELRHASSVAGLPQIAIGRAEGKLLQVLLRAVNARRVLELGTLGGYSAVWLARALPETGRLITVERDPDRAALALHFIERAGLANRVTVRVGAATELLPDLVEQGPFDAVFIDADKEGYPRYLDWCRDNVRVGGLVIADNALKKGQVLDSETQDPGVLGIREFNRRLASDPRFTSIVVPMRDGIAIAIVN